MTPRLAEPLHVCSTPTLAHIVNTARASSIITEAWSRFDSRFFVCKYFVVRLSTTKTTKILPLEKYPLYGIYHKREEICPTLATSNIIIRGAGTNSLGTLLLSKYISVLMLAYQHNISPSNNYYNNVHKILTFGTNGAPL